MNLIYSPCSADLFACTEPQACAVPPGCIGPPGSTRPSFAAGSMWGSQSWLQPSFRRLFGSRLIGCTLALLFALALQAQTPAGLTPGRRTVLDAHNCYPYEGRWVNRIDRALSQGFPISIEQDLTWYVDPATNQGRIVIHHGAVATGKEPGLREYFFDRVRPIVEKALRDNDRSQWPVIYLHFDFKSVAPALLEAVWSLLGEYPDWITTAPKLADPSILAPLNIKPIMVLTEEASEQEAAFFTRLPVGAKLRLFGSAATVRQKTGQPLLAPEQIVPIPATNYRRWWNSAWNAVESAGQPHAGDWTEASDQRLKALVAYAHKQGYCLRFYTLNGHTLERGKLDGLDPNYNFGTLEAAQKRWRAAKADGVDFIATDQIEDLAAAVK